ncbi:MAG TPA: arginine deiminase family protein [Streptosporangiaceae bacterium]|nr:arginine deiminase family protein [Streptosporangiaceae bacterium]
MSHCVGADSESGCLRAVLMHRPGAELRRITPKTRDLLGFGSLPWVARAQQEHDKLAEVLRERGTEVIYLTGLLQDIFEYACARQEAIAAVLANSELGEELASIVESHLGGLSPEDLTSTLIAGLTPAELRTGRGLVHDLLGPHDFIIEPLPNLVFGHDAGSYVGDHLVIGSLPGRRRRETDLLALIHGHHPRFAGSRGRGRPGGPVRVPGTSLDAGDLLLLGPGIVAVGAGVRTTAAATEQLARELLQTGTVHTVLAVPVKGDSQLGTLCTVLDRGIVLMAPALAYTLTAITITGNEGPSDAHGASGEPGALRVSRPRPFLEAAARALSLDQLTLVETGVVSPARSGRPYARYGQWDDGGNTLAIGGRTLICDERNAETNARLATAGFEVVPVPFGELGSARGGPRCMCGPMNRDPAGEASARELTPGYRTRLAPAEPGELAPLLSSSADAGAGSGAGRG